MDGNELAGNRKGKAAVPRNLCCNCGLGSLWVTIQGSQSMDRLGLGTFRSIRYHNALVRWATDAMIIQLDPPLWLHTPKGVGLAHFVERHSLEQSLYWTVFLPNTEIWTFENEKVRACFNTTLDRVPPPKG